MNKFKIFWRNLNDYQRVPIYICFISIELFLFAISMSLLPFERSIDECGKTVYSLSLIWVIVLVLIFIAWMSVFINTILFLANIESDT
jgi:hypothetical protein